MTTPNIFIIEGLDRLGKSTLIQGILDRLGYHQVMHFEKPKLLEYYTLQSKVNEAKCDTKLALEKYQRDSFDNMMKFIAYSKFAKIIFDRAHLGECVYSPMYRGYNGEYVFGLEETYGLQSNPNVRVILLTSDDFSFIEDDGLSFDITKRVQEQDLFIAALGKSRIQDKRIINVHDGHGSFRPAADILEEALK